MTERCANCGGDLVSDGKWATVHRPEECEITRILREWPEAERADGVLRVVRAIRAAVAEAESRARKEERDRWATSLGYASPEEVWREVNRKRGEQIAAAEARAREQERASHADVMQWAWALLAHEVAASRREGLSPCHEADMLDFALRKIDARAKQEGR